MNSKLVDVAVNAKDQVAATADRVRQVSAGVALIRTVAGLAALVALVDALPIGTILDAPLSVPLRIAMAILVAAIGVALFPRSRWITLVAMGAIGLWLVATIGLGAEVTVARVGVLAGALYVMHSASAFGAALPFDCVVAPNVLVRWLGRAGSVLGLGLLVGLGGMAVAGELPGARSVVGPIVGSLVAAALAGLLAWELVRRRR